MGDLRVVAENSEADLKKREAEEALAWPLKELAANLLRVIRGAGSPATLISQMNDVLLVAQEYREAFGHWPDPRKLNNVLTLQSPVSEVLSRVRAGSLSQATWDRWELDGTLDRMDAEHKIRRGALQLCASELVQQTTQARVGDNEMYDGIRALEESHRKYQEATRPKKPAPPKPARKPKSRKPTS